MVTIVSMPRLKYRLIRSSLFKDHKEHGCFLFVNTHFIGAVINLCVKEVHLIKKDHWAQQSDFHLELEEKEKVRVMQKAKKNNFDLIECHSHRFLGAARFSHTDIFGLDEFVQYIWWKLPGKIYGALVWTENDVAGQIWLPKRSAPLLISEIRIIN